MRAFLVGVQEQQAHRAEAFALQVHMCVCVYEAYVLMQVMQIARSCITQTILIDLVNDYKFNGGP